LNGVRNLADSELPEVGDIPIALDSDFNQEELEEGRVLFEGECTFMKGVVAMDGLPDSKVPEVCFAGRSNVGKSSLLNALARRKNLARTSNTPGRTQELNFFDMNNRLLMCDLPGYGYAKAPVGQVERWTALVKDYLRGRPNLRRVCLLIDSRHGLKSVDDEIMGMLDKSAISYQVILTKTDKLKKGQLEKVLAKTQEKLRKQVAAYPVVICTSSEKNEGIAEVRATLTQFADKKA
jgi:GTP-binding protein